MRSNKGAVTLYVILAMLTISGFLMAVYIRNANAEKVQTETTAKIKSTYEYYNFDEVYETIKNAKPEIKGYSIKYNKLTIETLKSNNISVDQNGKRIIYYAATTDNTAPNDIGEEIGKWQNSNIIDIDNSIYEKDIYIWIKNEDNIISNVCKIGVKSGGYTETGNKYYIDSNGQVATIPAGFTVSNMTAEKTITEGLVIYSGNVTNWEADEDSDGILDVQEKYNQYVWIPVENPNDMYGTLTDEDVTLNQDKGLIVGEKYGKLYFKTLADEASHLNWPSESEYSNTNSREPSMLSTYDTDEQYYKTILGYNSVNEYKEKMQKEFDNMITSIEKYKGFYIGRYELTGTESTPTVQKSKIPVYNTNWYSLYNACTKLENGNNNVHTSMIWGSQWDQALKKCLSFDNKFITDNVGDYGAYGGSAAVESGTKKAAYNIYDMSGNVEDWTLEAYSDNCRVARGGYYGNDKSTSPASFRNILDYPNNGVAGVGTRAQLYIAM